MSSAITQKSDIASVVTEQPGTDAQHNFYFCGSIRGGQQDVDIYMQIIKHLKTHGSVLTEHVGDAVHTAELMKVRVKLEREKGAAMLELTDQKIWDIDMAWLKSSHAVIAECTTTSMGVGYEIGIAESLAKPILCLYRKDKDVAKLSAMITGNPKVYVKYYETVPEACTIVDEFLKGLGLGLRK
ncbi:hypothetical protein HK097_005569 [Rhizophlyctis rosea]|uniref:Putative 2'-deoxynucleoside 5'-phosphate N-hydrolase 1 n=1 Tax=Rhizophlyctis rosea TaxID=64517 RepID=A0AAD5X626_9FUNG|nr:hypothetical protein HK097_005569 [Rhizophlyctis rosea]